MPTYIWTVTERSEEGDVSPFAYAYTSLDAACAAVRLHHAELWSMAGDEDDRPPLVTLVAEDTNVTLVAEDWEDNWPTWLVTRAELKQEG